MGLGTDNHPLHGAAWRCAFHPDGDISVAKPMLQILDRSNLHQSSLGLGGELSAGIVAHREQHDGALVQRLDPLGEQCAALGPGASVERRG